MPGICKQLGFNKIAIMVFTWLVLQRLLKLKIIKKDLKKKRVFAGPYKHSWDFRQKHVRRTALEAETKEKLLTATINLFRR